MKILNLPGKYRLQSQEALGSFRHASFTQMNWFFSMSEAGVSPGANEMGLMSDAIGSTMTDNANFGSAF